MKFEELFDMITSPDMDNIRMAIGLFNNHIDEFSEKEMEYMAYLIPSRVYSFLDKRCISIYSHARASYDSPWTYEAALPEYIYDLRMKVVRNISFNHAKD